jgi:hypothetical protein
VPSTGCLQSFLLLVLTELGGCAQLRATFKVRHLIIVTEMCPSFAHLHLSLSLEVLFDSLPTWPAPCPFKVRVTRMSRGKSMPSAARGGHFFSSRKIRTAQRRKKKKMGKSCRRLGIVIQVAQARNVTIPVSVRKEVICVEFTFGPRRDRFGARPCRPTAGVYVCVYVPCGGAQLMQTMHPREQEAA